MHEVCLQLLLRRAAANCYCQLLASQSDNNVKLIVLDKLQVRASGTQGPCCSPPCRTQVNVTRASAKHSFP